MLDSIEIAMVGEALAQSARKPSPIVHFVDEDDTGVEDDLTAVESTHDTRPFRPLNLSFILVYSVFIRSRSFYSLSHRFKALPDENADFITHSSERFVLEIKAGKTNV